MCHLLALFLWHCSVLHPLKTVFAWTICVAYCASTTLQHLDIFELKSYVRLHYNSLIFFLFCAIVSLTRFWCSSLFKKPTWLRPGATFCNRRFYHFLFFCWLSSILISSALNRPMTHNDLIALGLSTILIDWNFIAILIRVCLTAPVSTCSYFDRENYSKVHFEENAVFFDAVDSFVLKHFMKLLLLNSIGHWFQSVNIICEHLKTHLVVTFLATFSLLTTLVRINFGSNVRNALFSSQLSSFLREDNRPRSETETVSLKYNSNVFHPVYTNHRHTIHLFLTFSMVVFNTLRTAWPLTRAVYFGNFQIISSDYFNLVNFWLFVGSYLICASFYYQLAHYFAWACTCEACTKPKLRRSRIRSDCNPSEVCTANALINLPMDEPLVGVFKETPIIESDSTDRDRKHRHGIDNGDNETKSPISPEPPKLLSSLKSHTEDSNLISAMSDAEVLWLIQEGRLKTRELETSVKSLPRAVVLRRQDLATRLSSPHSIDRIPFANFDYRAVMGQCCEEVIGYIPIPLGKVGPLLLDGREHYLPLATTEGCLVASTNRGCRALYLSGGVQTAVFRDQMTRAPVIAFPSVAEVVECIAWVESHHGFQLLREAFNETSSHADLISIFSNPAGRYLHLRFAARTGEAMGMNMVSKGTDRALRCLSKYFPRMQVVSLSGNMCTDKKPAVINQLLGRGKSVLAEARLPGRILARVLHTDAAQLARLAQVKHWTGSAVAGTPGMAGCNAHAANLVAALFAATGQDLAQVVDSSACLTQLEVESDGSLYATVTMPCIEVGTVGGGTRLPAQRACIEMLDLSLERPAEHLARLVAGMVIAGELSLLAALASNDLVEAHMRLNRSAAAVAVATAGHPAVEKAEEKRQSNTDFPSPNAEHFAM